MMSTISGKAELDGLCHAADSQECSTTPQIEAIAVETKGDGIMAEAKLADEGDGDGSTDTSLPASPSAEAALVAIKEARISVDYLSYQDLTSNYRNYRWSSTLMRSQRMNRW